MIGTRLRLGHALVAARQLDRAIAVIEGVLYDCEQVRGPEDADTLGARDELAAAYLAAGRRSDAIAVYRRTLADRERTQGSRHPETMTTRQGPGRLLPGQRHGERGGSGLQASRR